MKAEATTAGLLLLLAVASLFAAYQVPGDLFLDFGPNDLRYVTGFREDFEIDEPTLIHWTRDRSRIRLPFVLRGPYEVTLRYKRHVEKPAEVRLFLGGEPVESFTAPRQDFTLRTIRRESPDRERFELGLLSSSEDPRPLGLALDWMSVKPSPGLARVLPTALAWLWLVSWVLLFYGVARLLGLHRRWAFAVGALALLGLVAATLSHRLWPIHAASTLGLRAHVLILALTLFHFWRSRRPGSIFAHPAARWAVLVACAALSVRLFALFHPDFYYPDVRTHSKFVSIIWTEGLESFLENHIANQHRHLLGLQYVSGRWAAFPYPPLLYLTIYPLSLLELPVDDWMKLVPTALLSVEALLVFALAGKLGCDPRTGLLAVVLHSTARVAGFRLAVASYAALYGHFWDVLFVLYLSFFYERLERPLVGAGLGALAAISLLSYAGSALVLGLFVPLLCLALAFASERRPPFGRIGSIAGWSLAGALAALLLFYRPYVPELLHADEAASGSGGATGLIDLDLTPLAALQMTWHRLRLFYGWPYGALLLGALGAFLWRRGTGLHALAVPLALAALGTYLGMNFLRSGLGSTSIFQFSKDDLVLLPLAAILLGAVLRSMSARGPGLRVLAAALLLGWVTWGGISLARDVHGRFLRPGYPPAEKTTWLPPARLA